MRAALMHHPRRRESQSKSEHFEDCLCTVRSPDVGHTSRDRDGEVECKQCLLKVKSRLCIVRRPAIGYDCHWNDSFEADVFSACQPKYRIHVRTDVCC